MSQRKFGKIEDHEIAHLAYLNWRHDGCPDGQDKQYWFEAEHQLRATRDLLIAEYHFELLPIRCRRPTPGSRRSAARTPRKSPGKHAAKKPAFSE